MWYDIHSHLHTMGAPMSGMRSNYVGTNVVGTTAEDSHKAVLYAEKHHAPDLPIRAVVGIHPTHEADEHDIQTIAELAGKDCVVGIGECGFDFFRREKSKQEYARQEALFRAQLDIAQNNKLPVMLHIRPERHTMQAYRDALDILAEYPAVHAHFHFFDGNKKILRRIIEETTHSVSFTGVITYDDRYDEMLLYVPLDRIHIETDAPYVIPAPYKNQYTQAEPWMVLAVAEKIATVRNMRLSALQEQLAKNYDAVFGSRK